MVPKTYSAHLGWQKRVLFCFGSFCVISGRNISCEFWNLQELPNLPSMPVHVLSMTHKTVRVEPLYIRSTRTPLVQICKSGLNTSVKLRKFHWYDLFTIVVANYVSYFKEKNIRQRQIYSFWKTINDPLCNPLFISICLSYRYGSAHYLRLSCLWRQFSHKLSKWYQRQLFTFLPPWKY